MLKLLKLKHIFGKKKFKEKWSCVHKTRSYNLKPSAKRRCLMVASINTRIFLLGLINKSPVQNKGRK